MSYDYDNILGHDFFVMVRAFANGIIGSISLPDIKIEKPLQINIIHLIHPSLFRTAWHGIAALTAPYMCFDGEYTLYFKTLEDAVRGCDVFYTSVYYQYGHLRYHVESRMLLFNSAVRQLDQKNMDELSHSMAKLGS
jgi:hypothetical protein